MNDYEFKVTSWNDNNMEDQKKFDFDNALSAVHCFDRFVDHGFADEYRTVNLFEPNGKCHTKVLYRNGMTILR